MQSFGRMIVEDPLGIYLVLVAVAAVLLAVWAARRNPRVLLAAAVVVAAIAIVAVLDLVVTTDNERIVEGTEAIVTDVENGQLGVLAERMAEDYAGLGVNRKGALDMASRMLSRAGIRNIILRNMSVTISPEADTASQTFVTFVEGERPTYLRWRVRWARRNGTWKIVRIDSPEPEIPGRS